MDFDEYVTARHTRLVEHARELGASEEDAPTYVAQVLEQQRRRIRRSDDPDPLVREALADALHPRAPVPPQVRVALAAAGVLAVVAAASYGGWLLLRPDPPEPVPSVFGYDATRATSVLADAGFRVRVESRGACEPEGQVITEDPPAGARAEKDATVVVEAADPAPGCAQDPARTAAWAFVGFARGGSAPEFARTVHLVVDGEDAGTLSADAARDLGRWAGVLDDLRSVAAAAAQTDTGLARLLVEVDVPPSQQCGVDRPTGPGERPALRLQVDPAAEDDPTPCPVTVDLYRSGSDSSIDGVVVYSAQETPRP